MVKENSSRERVEMAEKAGELSPSRPGSNRNGNGGKRKKVKRL